MVVHWVQVGDVIDDHYASLTSHRRFLRWSPIQFSTRTKEVNFGEATGTGVTLLVQAVLLYAK